MNNYADYAATQLQYYGLTPNSAENDGQGTVWTHYAISRFLVVLTILTHTLTYKAIIILIMNYTI